MPAIGVFARQGIVLRTAPGSLLSGLSKSIAGINRLEFNKLPEVEERTMSRFDESTGIRITQLQADSKPAISCRLAHCPLPSFPQESCLIASFSGVIADSDTHEDGYPYMHAMIGSGFAACNPATLIVDLRELPYESGDRMSKIIDQRLITKVIVSEVNRDALTRLIASVHFLDPKAELFESLPEALEACDSAYRRFLSAGLKKTMASDF